jgi:hypothetical protein
MVSGMTMSLMDLLGILTFAIGGTIVFFAFTFAISQAQSTSVNFMSLASFMSSFAFVGRTRALFDLQTATQNPKHS